jgi:hypothetical protein
MKFALAATTTFAASCRRQLPTPHVLPPRAAPSPPQKFGRHIDESNELGGGRYTAYTLLIYLSSCGGGDTIFYGGRNRRLAAVAPQPGLALLHRHGDDCLEHEAAAVTGGVKYVLRSDVVFQRR